jgi:hypothetical protein
VLLLPPDRADQSAGLIKNLASSTPQGVRLLTLHRGSQPSEDGDVFAIELAVVALSAGELGS